MKVLIRVNGRGNAWPLELGTPTNLRDAARRESQDEYANTSLSLIGLQEEPPQTVSWEILFDVGQGVVPFLVRHNNRLPNAVILSHPHFDHIAGLDWLVASHRRHRTSEQALPVYTSKPCWDAVMRTFGYLQSALTLGELRPGEYCQIAEAPELWLKPFPVFHGDYAPGACLMLVEYRPPARPPVKAILTGDLLCPLLRQQDYESLRNPAVVYVDANTRFPWPPSGHWSILPRSAVFDDWREGLHPSYLITPHARSFEPVTHGFLDDFLHEQRHCHDLCWTIRDFVERVQPQKVQLVHYSGYEDQQYHGEAILTDEQLLAWVERTVDRGGQAGFWGVPQPGNIFTLDGSA